MTRQDFMHTAAMSIYCAMAAHSGKVDANLAVTFAFDLAKELEDNGCYFTPPSPTETLTDLPRELEDVKGALERVMDALKDIRRTVKDGNAK